MTDATADDAGTPPANGKKGLILGVALALLGAAGGYFLTSGGLLSAAKTGESGSASGDAPYTAAAPKVEFVDLAPIVISLAPGSEHRHLRFHAQLEVNKGDAAAIEALRPRITDVLNGYLRAVEVADLTGPLALTRLRGHMQRRINIVVGEGRVRDVLVMEFVLN